MDPKFFYVGIKGVIVQNSKALVLEKIDQQGKRFWDIPGGRIGEGEDINDTLQRELKEEIPSIDAMQIGELLNVYKLPRNLNDGSGLLLIFYKVKAKLSKVTISEEHLSYKWITKGELTDLVELKEPYVSDGVKQALILAL